MRFNNDIMVISNKESISNNGLDVLKRFSESATKGCKTVNIFREDTCITQSCLGENIKLISGLTSMADKLVYMSNESRLERTVYLKQLESEQIFSEVYDACTFKYPIPSKETCFSQQDFDNKRISTVSKRLKFNMSRIADMFQVIVLIKRGKQFNLVNTVTPKMNDGKMIYEYDDIKNKGVAYVGGRIIPEEILLKYIEGVTT